MLSPDMVHAKEKPGEAVILAITDTKNAKMLSNIVHLLPAGRNHSFSIMPDKYKTVNILHQIKIFYYA